MITYTFVLRRPQLMTKFHLCYDSSLQEVYRGDRLPDLRNHHLVQTSVRPGKYEAGQIDVRARILQGLLPPSKHSGYAAQRHEWI